MSAEELRRVAVLGRVAAGTLSLRSAATLLHLGYRQMKRIAKRFRQAGAAGLRHPSAGRVSNHARRPRERARILALVRTKYSGAVGKRFGPTLAAEHLASEDGIAIHHDTLRRWMLEEGLWRPHAGARRPGAWPDHPWRRGFQNMGRDVPIWQVADR